MTVRPLKPGSLVPVPAPDAGEGHGGRASVGAGGTVGIDAPITPAFTHRIRFTHGAFEPSNSVLDDVIDAPDGPARCIVVIDDGVIAADPENVLARVRAGLEARSRLLEPRGEPLVVPGGEQSKVDRAVVDAVVEEIHRHGICRRSYVVAIGGGAVLDAVGFAAATAHRGVRLIRFPTTTLAQDDAGIGVKNGINAFGTKNFVGAFAVPWAVINDFDFLRTQSRRDRIAGVSEAVKVALLKDVAAWNEIRGLAPRIAAGDVAALEPVVRRSAELHLEHIAAGGDPFESQIARPLDFGHWAAHRLEELTAFEVRHGEAVSMGLALDVTYAARIGRLSAADRDAVIESLVACGLPVRHPAFGDADAVLSGLEAFREHLGGRLTITLIEGPGRPIDVHEIDDASMRFALDACAGPWEPPSEPDDAGGGRA